MIAIVVVSFCALFGQLNASAIPMWEYLTRQEKMSFLYSVFASQVENFCDSSTMMNCNTELLKYGLDRMKTMPEDVLDGMDPYQRAANDIIWATLLKGHPNARAVPRARSTTTAKPNSYEDQSFDFGAQGAESARIDNVVYFLLPPPKGFKPSSSSFNDHLKSQRHPYAQNIVGLLSEKQGVYTRYQQQHSTTTPHPYDSFEEEMEDESPLSGGPMVVRVYPDGRPVIEADGDDKEMQQDEDLQQYKLSQLRIPNF